MGTDKLGETKVKRNRKAQKAWLAAVLTALVLLPLAAQAQNSELPLQAGQKVDEEIAKLTALLQSPDASLHDKAVACKRLGLFGDKRAVPVLASLLTDEKLSHYARMGLEPIPDPAVDEALRAALSKVKGRLLVGVINSIGNRQDEKAVGDLQRLLSSADSDVAAAAAAALGRIATVQTAGILKEQLGQSSGRLRTAVADASLTCAELLLKKGEKDAAIQLYDTLRQADVPKHIQVAATFGAVRSRGAAGISIVRELLGSPDEALFDVGLKAARELGGEAAADALAARLEKASPLRKAKLILALSDVGGPKAAKLVLQAARSGPAVVRDAAARGLRKVGSADALPVLLDMATGDDPQLAQTAVNTLELLPGDQVDAAIQRAVGRAGSASLPLLLDLIGRRRIQGALPVLLDAVDSPDVRVRVAALRSLGEMAGPDKLDLLWQRWLSAKDNDEKAAAKQAVLALCVRSTQPDQCVAKLAEFLRSAPEPGQAYALELMEKIGGRAALRAVVKAAQSSNPKLRDTATRVLGEWMTADVAPALLDLAQTLPERKYKIRCLRGALRAARQLAMTEDQRLQVCREALQLADRPDEKRLVLDVLARYPSARSLELALAALSDKDVKGYAARRAVDIAERVALTDREAARAAAARVLESGAGGPTAERARSLLERVGP